MLAELYANASVGMFVLAQKVVPPDPKPDPYPPLCDLNNMVNPFFAFVIGQVKGVLPRVIYVIIFLCGVAVLLLNKRIQKEGLRKALIVVSCVFIFGGIWNFSKSINSGDTC